MTSIREAIRRRFAAPEPLPAGIYHYQAPQEDPRNYRLHLRIEPGGNGLLIVNAATVLHLNTTATEYAFHLVQGSSEEQVAESLASRYRVNRERAVEDYREFVDRIEILVTTPDLDPVTFLDIDRQAPYSGEISVPYRLDCALTYRLAKQSDLRAAPTERVDRELSTEQWKSILDKAWQAGIPHVIFTGGEATLREDLVQLVEHAEMLGQVAGLITDGQRLVERSYLDDLLQTGLDHLLIILDADNESSWAAIQKVISEDISLAVHVTLTRGNRMKVEGDIKRLAEMGVDCVSLSEESTGLSAELEAIRETAASLDLSLVWDLPVPYSALNPVSLEVADRDRPEGAGRAWLYVEPDGDVLPAQGVYQVLGNLLTDGWEEIWKA